MSVKQLASRACAVFCVIVVVASFAGSADRSHNRYPHELQGFSLYAEYLAPLEPGLSSKETVHQVLGDTVAIRRNGWTVNTIYTTKDGPVLAEIILRPDSVIPMAAVKFPPRFAHCHSSLSEFNISFDVYSDASGLQYWLHEEDSKWGKKGDLFRIVYGPQRRPFPPHTTC